MLGEGGEVDPGEEDRHCEGNACPSRRLWLLPADSRASMECLVSVGKSGAPGKAGCVFGDRPECTQTTNLAHLPLSFALASATRH